MFLNNFFFPYQLENKQTFACFDPDLVFQLLSLDIFIDKYTFISIYELIALISFRVRKSFYSADPFGHGLKHRQTQDTKILLHLIESSARRHLQRRCSPGCSFPWGAIPCLLSGWQSSDLSLFHPSWAIQHLQLPV